MMAVLLCPVFRTGLDGEEEGFDHDKRHEEQEAAPWGLW